MDEKQLITGCVGGDRVAQKALYDRFSRKMMAVCLRYFKNREDASDALQEGFIKVYANIGRYSGEGSFEGWIRRIFVNGAIEQLRRNNVLKDADDIDDASYADIPDAPDDLPVTADELMQCVGSLPDGCRTVFNLYAIEGYSHKEIGTKLNISEGTSRSQYLRARKLLRDMILKHNLLS